MAKSWRVTCPGCRETRTLDENQVGLAQLKAALLVLQDPAGMREQVENHTILCPACGQRIPFEPRSRYRQRKAAAIRQRLDDLGRLNAADKAGRNALAVALKFGTIFHDALQTDYPLDELRAMADKNLQVLAEEAAAGQPELRNHPAIQSLFEIMAIAKADIGERTDLPEVPMDDLEEKRRNLVRAVDDLQRKPDPVSPAPAPPAAAGNWIDRARDLGNAAPYSIRIPYGTALALPNICAGCGAPGTEIQPMAKGAADETPMMKLPVCKPCYDDGNSDYWKRKLKMGGITLLAMAGLFGGMAADSAPVTILGCLLIPVAFLVGSGAGRGQQVPLLKRRPFIKFDARSMELFASTAFILATYDAIPDLRHVK